MSLAFPRPTPITRGIVLFFAVIFLNGWIGDDPFITFRVIDNLLHGYGLRWNIDERVQVFTHPLWMILNIPLYFVTRNVVVTTTIMSLACIAAGLALLYRMRTSNMSFTWLVLLPLALCTTTRDFFVSGFENPLNFALMVWFLYTLFHEGGLQNIQRLCFISSLLLLTRLDDALIIAPVLAASLWHHRTTLPIRQLCVAWMPLIGWFLFSLLYYGFFFPNTMNAKLNVGLGSHAYISHGLCYYQNLLYYDPLGVVLILVGTFLSIMIFLRPTHDPLLSSQNSGILLLLSAGGVLQMLYVLRIGGDMASGRFLMNVMVMHIVILAQTLRMNRSHMMYMTGALMGFIAVLQIFWLDAIRPYRNPYVAPYRYVVYSERGYYVDTNSLLHWFIPHWTTKPDHHWVTDALQVRRNPGVYVYNNIGMYGYYAGPKVIIIDMFALSDPLLAALPMDKRLPWRTGHYRRNVPKGYIKARRTGDTSYMDPTLAHYYEKLRIVTSGDLWSIERLRTILGFQLGEYSVDL